MVKNVYKKAGSQKITLEKHWEEGSKNFSSVCKYFIKIEILTLQVAFHDKLF